MGKFVDFFLDAGIDCVLEKRKLLKNFVKESRMYFLLAVSV